MMNKEGYVELEDDLASWGPFLTFYTIEHALAYLS